MMRRKAPIEMAVTVEALNQPLRSGRGDEERMATTAKGRVSAPIYISSLRQVRRGHRAGWRDAAPAPAATDQRSKRQHEQSREGNILLEEAGMHHEERCHRAGSR